MAKFHDGETTITLGPRDSALVFRDDGTEEIFNPIMPDDGIATDSMVKSLQCGIALHNPRVFAVVEKALDASIAKARKERING